MARQSIGQRCERSAFAELCQQILQLAPGEPIAADVDQARGRSIDDQRVALAVEPAGIFGIDETLRVDLERERIARFDARGRASGDHGSADGERAGRGPRDLDRRLGTERERDTRRSPVGPTAPGNDAGFAECRNVDAGARRIRPDRGGRQELRRTPHRQDRAQCRCTAEQARLLHRCKDRGWNHRRLAMLASRR